MPVKSWSALFAIQSVHILKVFSQDDEWFCPDLKMGKSI
jgi:hypothetical protein